jgi:hypothetical protein
VFWAFLTSVKVLGGRIHCQGIREFDFIFDRSLPILFWEKVPLSANVHGIGGARLADSIVLRFSTRFSLSFLGEYHFCHTRYTRPVNLTVSNKGVALKKNFHTNATVLRGYSPASYTNNPVNVLRALFVEACASIFWPNTPKHTMVRLLSTQIRLPSACFVYLRHTGRFLL